MTVSENLAGSEKPDLVAMVNGRVLEPGESVKLPDIPERLRQGGLPVLKDEEMSRSVRKAIHRDWKATFALYGEPDYVVLSYDRQIDPQIVPLIEDYALERIHDAKSPKEVTQIQAGMRFDLGLLQSGSYLWIDSIDRFKDEGKIISRDLEKDIMTMENILHLPVLTILGKKYDFIANRELLGHIHPNENGFRLVMSYNMVE